MAYVKSSWCVTAMVFSGLFLSLLSSPVTWAELKPGEVLSQENWQEAKGLLPDAILHRFQDGSYQAKIITLPNALGWGSKFTAATETNAGKFSIDAADSLTDKATNAYPAFLYGYPFPQVDPKDPQAAAKVIYNFSYTLMQADDADRLSNLHWVTPSFLERRAEFRGQLLFYGSRFSGPIANPDATLRKGIVAGYAPQEIYGVVTLEWVYLDPQKWNSIWGYVPELRRVRQLPPSNGSESLFGSDLVHDDPYLFSGKVQYFTWKLIGVQEALVPYTLPNPKPLRRANNGYRLESQQDLLVMGWEKEGWKGKAWWPTDYRLVKRPVWVVEATAKDQQYAYRRQVLWIDKDLYIAYYKEAYERSGQLWHMLLSSVSVARAPEGDLSLAQPDFTLSIDEQQNHATVELPFKQERPLAFGIGLSGNSFTPAELMKRGK
ncbi:MAG TPA: DUF1329 domain-containing protein [Candidatus Binatia bacterium]|jgi:hypothetical protein|nr:DUF1329 domain-containing protein [Candidatus Binatia bacterium]